MARSLFWLYYLVIISFRVTQSAWEDGDNGIDRVDGDMPNMPVDSDAPNKCATLCNNNNDCVAWAYCLPNCGGQRGSVCYLKSTITVQSLNPCRVSIIIMIMLLVSH